ncbi:hypothetical protein AB0A70_20880 [Streptomyces morookaense]|uniref:DUF7848 domain-containing protein n=1 Tax=Streptomyces morookaense TaxID=1970 RepID=UPI0034073B83
MEYEIRTHLDTLAYRADCLGCSWKVRDKPEPEPVQDACMKHAAASGHWSFRMVCEGISIVFRKEER